jgi:hypothetical protein
MTLKAYVGGWEQTGSVTVQCLTSPTDSVLNDSTTDYQVRETLLDELSLSLPDSAPDLGYDATHIGFRRERGGIIWKLSNGSFLAVDQPDSSATDCHYTFSAGSPPQSGAVPSAVYHTHPNIPGDTVYGCGRTPNGLRYKDYPGDNAGLDAIVVDDSAAAGGSSEDWGVVNDTGSPGYMIDKAGYVFKLSPTPNSKPDRAYVKQWIAKGKVVGKCAWVPKAS